MKKMNLLCGVILLAGVSFSSMALADRGHGRGHSHGSFGLYFGIPYPYSYYPYSYYPYSYYPYPYYTYPYYPPVVVNPAQPPAYVEKGDEQAAPEDYSDDYYWYHCEKPEGYYPYIKECPAGWQKVEPTPPPNP